MDDVEDDAGYPPNPHHQRHHFSSHHHKLPARGAPAHAGHRRRYSEDKVEENEEVEGSSEEEDERNQNAMMEQSVDGQDEDEDEEEEVGGAVGEEEEVGGAGGSAYRRAGAEPFKRRRKRRRLDRLALGFEFAPRVAAPAPPPSAPSRPPPTPARSSPAADWSEDSTFVLLDAWGDLYIQNGRKNLRSDEWMEVAKKVLQSSRTARSEAQCRNRLDTLKKKYKKEKSRMAESDSNSSSRWVYFAKMDSLMTSLPAVAAREAPGLPCGFDSGEYVFMNSRVYVNRSNDLDEMRDSPGDSECEDEGDDDSDGLPPERAKGKGNSDSSSSFTMLADSIQKFGEIYEKIEDSKRQHMAELERMRKEFHRDLEVQKRQILERAQAEIAKIRQGAGEDDEDDDGEEREDGDINNEDEEIDVSLDDGSS